MRTTPADVYAYASHFAHHRCAVDRAFTSTIRLRSRGFRNRGPTRRLAPCLPLPSGVYLETWLHRYRFDISCFFLALNEAFSRDRGSFSIFFYKVAPAAAPVYH